MSMIQAEECSRNTGPWGSSRNASVHSSLAAGVRTVSSVHYCGPSITRVLLIPDPDKKEQWLSWDGIHARVTIHFEWWPLCPATIGSSQQIASASFFEVIYCSTCRMPVLASSHQDSGVSWAIVNLCLFPWMIVRCIAAAPMIMIVYSILSPAKYVAYADDSSSFLGGTMGRLSPNALMTLNGHSLLDWLSIWLQPTL